jgi:hypothetical protein
MRTITITRNAGMLALSVWLILMGLAQVGIAIPGIILGLLAIAAGIIILIGR